MTRAGRAFIESVVVHGVLAGVFLVLGGMLTPTPETIRLDFSLQAPVLAPAAPVPVAAPQVTKAPAAVQKPPPARAVVPKPRPRPQVRSQAPPQTAPSLPDQHPTAAAKAPDTAVAPDDPATASTDSAQGAAASGTGTPPANAGEAYRRAHFIAIRDAILAQLRYPMIARRQGWSGQVEVAFLIAPDGSVSELRIRTTSGHEVLDEQALAAIRRAAPFAPPRVAALLVMPVAFQLN